MTENIEKIKSPEELLSEFQQEMTALKEQEEKETDPTKKTAHFERINLTELTMKDLEIYQKTKDKSITEEDLNKYSKDLKKEEVSQSRKEFIAFIGNKAFVIFGQRHLKETEEK